MKLLKAKVDWAEEYANDPTIKILVDGMPKLSDLRYHQKGSLYYSELDGYVNFYYYNSPGRGFGNRSFELVMANGEKKTLKGPFSSKAAIMNETGFGPCLDVSIIDSLTSYERGYTFYAGHVTLDFIERSKHIVEIGEGYHKKCGSGVTKSQEEFVEFPKGSSFIFYKQHDECYSPAVLLPDGEVWVKNIREETTYRCSDLSAEQST